MQLQGKAADINDA